MPLDPRRLLANLIGEGYVTGPGAAPAAPPSHDAPGPPRITTTEAADCARALQDHADQGIAARGKEAARLGLTIACEVGCNACCREPIVVWRGEALAIARWLLAPENAPTLRAFRDAYTTWVESAGAAHRAVAEQLAGNDRDGHRRAHIDAWRQRVLCPFNDARGMCGIYPVRPLVCRYNHALDTAAGCEPDVAVQARRLSFKPLDEFIERARIGNVAVHHAAGGARMRPVPLPDAVWELVKDAP